MAVFIAFPILGLLVILQSAIVTQVPLLHGSADLILLALIAWGVQPRVTTSWHWTIIGAFLLSIVTALPLISVLFSYILVTGLTLLLRNRIWQWPLLVMLTVTFLGTLITHLLTIATLRITGTNIPLAASFNLITLPSALLNLLLAVPMYALIGDLASWVYPEEIEI
jgi:hypothetical protein